MKKFSAVLMLLIFATVMSTNAQEDAPKPKYVVWEAKVEIAQLEKLLAALDEVHKYQKELGYQYGEIIQYTDEGYLWASSAIESLGGLDKIFEADKKLWAADPEKSKKLGKNFEGSYSKVGGMVLELQPELSIMPPEQAMPTSGKRFRLFEKFYVKDAKGEAFSELVKKYVALRKKLGYNQPFYTFSPVLAADMSVVYFISEMGENPSENLSLNDEFWGKTGEAGGELYEGLKETISHIDQYFGTIDFDHSYFPEK